MIEVAPNLQLKGARGAVQPGQCRDQGLAPALGSELFEALANPCDEGQQLAQIGCALALGACTHARIGALFVLGVQRVDEQARAGHQALADGPRAALVVGKPQVKFSGGQRLGVERIEHALRVLGVGARQRGHHPGRRPGGQGSQAHRAEQRIG
jgi:hypothetical protein